MRPPRPLVALAGGVVVVGVVVVLLGGWRTGVSYDESYHVLRMRSWLDHGWYLLDGDLLGDEPGPWQEQRYVYGPLTMQLLQGWSVLWGGDPGAVSASAHAYAVRHLGVGVIGLGGVAAAAGLSRLLLRRWTWGLVTAAVLLALPVWAGHSMFNVKDVPVATGYTLATLGLALLVLRADDDARRPVRPGLRLLSGCTALVAGVVLAVGTRPGIWPGLALGVALVLVTRDRVRIAAVLGSLCVAYLLLLVSYPSAFATPLQALVGGALESSRFDGRSGDWWYLPLFTLVEVPTLVLVAALAGAVVGVRLAWRSWRHSRRWDPREVVLALVLAQAFVLPVLAVVRQSNIYTGVRQMLFAAPAVAVLATVGVAALLASRASWRRRPVLRAVVPVAVVVGLVGPLVVQLQLFPYSYAYSTVLASAASPTVERLTGYGVQTDYWRTSVRELAPEVPADGWVTCSPTMDEQGRWYRWSRDTHDDCAGEVVSPLSAYAERRDGDDSWAAGWQPTPTRFLAVQTGSDAAGSNCTKHSTVRRWLYWREVEMGFVATCDLVLPAYPAGGLDFDDADGSTQGGETLLGGWDIHPSRRGLGTEPAGEDDTPSLGFTLEVAEGAGLVLSGTAEGAGALRLSVNGTPLPAESTGESWTASVPAPVAAHYGEGRVVVDVEGPGVRLLSLAAAPAPPPTSLAGGAS
ncbi:hypothetical protein [Nocardioides nanhaiensis]|uniref:Glycosyltransferase RgtA/B/C/D-like domain-containing protein n=1 Tax=Nocardioides nanhaiensis TaxID=1476871 RepID=A0ABP8WS75_9ACTN